MCFCTEYASPTCQHSWISLTESCGFGANLLTCPRRQPVQSCIAPPHCCAICDGAHEDPAICQMVIGRSGGMLHSPVPCGLDRMRSRGYRHPVEYGYGPGRLERLGGLGGLGYGNRHYRDGRKHKLISRTKHYVKEQHGGTGCVLM